MARAAKEVVGLYLEAWKSGRPVDKELIAPDITFVGPLMQFKNRDEFLAGMAKVAPAMKLGSIRRQLVDGPDVCTVYECQTPVGVIPMAEIAHVEDGKIRRLEIYCDARELAKIHA